MKSSSKVILVLAGYLLALVMAWAVVTMYVAATSGPDRQTYGAMFNFGDTILFLGVFGLASLPATGAALFFLRPYQVFWRVLAAGAVAIAVTGIIVLVDMLVSRNSTAGALLGQWSMVSPIRFFLAPVLAMVFFACGWFAPTRFTRIAFLCATAVETVVFTLVALIWFHPFRQHVP
jgi:hypothetical protein